MLKNIFKNKKSMAKISLVFLAVASILITLVLVTGVFGAGDDDYCVGFEDGTSCNDGDWCNGPDTCQAQVCTNTGSPIDCSYLDDICNNGVCDEGSSSCIADPLIGNYCGDCKDYGCDIDSVWETLDYWYEGTETCDDEGECSSDTCKYLHTCADIFIGDGVPNIGGGVVNCEANCDQDSDCPSYCEQGTRYYNGICDFLLSCACNYDSEDCDAKDGFYCDGTLTKYRDYSCAPGGCDYVVIGTPEDCDNGLYCDGQETCSEGSCIAGTAPNCNDGVGCTEDSCNEQTDSCENNPFDSLCNDGAWCNGVETCDAELDCIAGTAPDCGDGVGCTDDSCDESSNSCVNDVNDGNCDNDLWCDGTETCDAVLDCVAGTAPDCGDGVGCTDDSCDES